MKPRMCKIKHEPPKTYGDCIRTCIATLVNRDDVPHTYDGGNPQKAWADIREYLKTLNKSLAMFAVEDPFDFMRENCPDVPYILLHKTARGEDHAVVCLNDKVWHNPAWYPSPVAAPHSIGHWIVLLIGEFPRA